MSYHLALLGGKPEISWKPSPYNPIGEDEIAAANRVLRSGTLSDFIGARGDKFLGGKEVRDFEEKICSYYGVKNAISVNSLTSGLICAVGALDIEPGDEIIVSPWTMCATATAILVWNAIPVFADIDKNSFNLSITSIVENITDKTKAIVVPSIFGLPAQMDKIMVVAREYGLRVIEDVAQAPGVKYKGKYIGTYGDIGGFSFNYHKHIHCGEGGVCVTNDSKLAQRMQMIRNHAEAVVEDNGINSLSNMVGFNFRLGEIEAAIASAQMQKIDHYVNARYQQGVQLNRGLAPLDYLRVPEPYELNGHAYYVYAMHLENCPVARDRLADALIAEGIPGVCRRYMNIHRLPMYQKKIAYGEKGYPWTDINARKDVSYEVGVCPVAEKMNDEDYLALAICQYDYSTEQIDDIVRAFGKVWQHMEELTYVA